MDFGVCIFPTADAMAPADLGRAHATATPHAHRCTGVGCNYRDRASEDSGLCLVGALPPRTGNGDHAIGLVALPLSSLRIKSEHLSGI